MNVSTIRMIGALLGALLAVIPFWKIFSKAGFSGWLALLAVIPIVNLVVLYYVAFSEWKTGQTSEL